MEGVGSKWIITQNVLIKGEMITWTTDSFGMYKDVGYDFCCEQGNWWMIKTEVRPATEEEIISHLNK